MLYGDSMVSEIKRRSVFLLFLLFTFLLLSSLVTASYEIGLNTVDNAILPNESATFKVSISNFGRYAERFQIYTLDTHWVLQIVPPVSSINPESLQEYQINVRPKSTVRFGSSALDLIIKDLKTKTLHHESLIIDVENPNRLPGVYVPSVKLSALYDKSVDPRDNLVMTLNFQNRNALDIKNMSVVIDSQLFHKRYVTDLKPLGEKSDEQVFSLDPYQPPGEYPLTVSLILNNKTVNELSRTITIKKINDVVEQKKRTSFLFRSVTTLRIENKGNTEVTYTAELPTSIFRRIFSSAVQGKAVKKVDGSWVYLWNVTLSPKASENVTLTENYRLLVLLILLVAVAILIYYMVRAPLIVVKETILPKDEHDKSGTTSTLKVRIFVKNRVRKQLSNVQVIDRVPSIATYTEQNHLGTIQPTKVLRSKKGTVLKWELDLLEPYEERILSYSLASRLKIVGKMKLQSAKVVYVKSDGKERTLFTKNSVFEE